MALDLIRYEIAWDRMFECILVTLPLEYGDRRIHIFLKGLGANPQRWLATVVGDWVVFGGLRIYNMAFIYIAGDRSGAGGSERQAK